MCDCTEDEGRGGGSRVKGGAFSFQAAVKSLGGGDLGLKRTPGAAHKQVLEQL